MSNAEPQALDAIVCAVIISFHPKPEMIENMKAVLNQVQGLIVIDNGSGADALLDLREASRRHGFHLIENGANLGIAEALNKGVIWAKNQRFPWIILFDQDSKITEGFVQKMFSSLHGHHTPERVGSMHPRYVNPVTGIEPKVLRAPDGGPISSMTSGALMPTWIFDRIGLFSTDYFIDQVDIEYGYRIRAHGYLSADSREATLLHSAGNPKRINFFGFSFEPTHHNPVRRYYLTRNRIVVYRTYFRQFPVWILQSMYYAFRETIKCLLAEHDRWRKLRSLILGTWDGINGRMGKRENI